MMFAKDGQIKRIKPHRKHQMELLLKAGWQQEQVGDAPVKTVASSSQKSRSVHSKKSTSKGR